MKKNIEYQTWVKKCNKATGAKRQRSFDSRWPLRIPQTSIRLLAFLRICRKKNFKVEVGM